jgi:predicted ATP-grasp superfamily ATP-dependent carboligase
MNNLLLITKAPHWFGISRIPKMLQKEGFNVIGIGPGKSYLSKSKYVSQFYSFKSDLQFQYTCYKAIMKHKVDLVIPGDDLSIEFLSKTLKKKFCWFYPIKKIQKIIQNSCGNFTTYDQLSIKSNFQKLAEKYQVNTPKNITVSSLDEAIDIFESRKNPLVLKKDQSEAGSGVRICKNKSQLIKAYQEFDKPSRPLGAKEKVKSAVKKIFGVDAERSSDSLSVQDYIRGRLCSHNVFASKGKVLSSYSLMTEMTYPTETSSSSVVRVIVNKEMELAAKKLIAATGFTGFAGFDFIMDSYHKVHLLECNARPTPTTHISHLLGGNLFAMVKQHLGIRTDKPAYTSVKHRYVALFPKEIMRDPNSMYARKYYHDVPVGEEYLFESNKEIVSRLNSSSFSLDTVAAMSS